MVLRVDWLRSLGSILWNFFNLTMQFNFNGAVVQLQGYNPRRDFGRRRPFSQVNKRVGDRHLVAIDRRGALWRQR